ncbi:OmpA family protein [Pseudomonas caspiana]|uniref:Flagellar motor protein MotB n=1 Tax=Pseudomonas caspiana TaxID=1451454 RepID=A0A1Y3NUM9_9PSED|nr:OmpA family protein [Pseudomonas caspiana]OUM71247.1 flagellar motor protein MotB [Pseudomonas caspiana]
MTLKLTRGLWLWASVLALALLAIIPMTTGLRAWGVFAIACCMIVAWVRAGRRAARQSDSQVLVDAMSLPPAAYRQPVILVCGDGLQGLFGAVAAEQSALRVTRQGCYIRVPDLQLLSAVASSVMSLRPGWGGQLSVMFIVNPGEHADSPAMAGRVRTFCFQATLVRKRGIALPLLLVSYVQASQGSGPWFSWEAGQTNPSAREPDACVSLCGWQQQSADCATYSERLQTSVQLNSIAGWLSAEVLPHLVPTDVRNALGLPFSCAITLVSRLPEAAPGSLWHQWLCDKVGLTDTRPNSAEADTSLPFPDPLLHALPTHFKNTAVRRASVIAVWLFALFCLIAMANSAWQNNLLLRQVSDDLRRYTAIPQPSRQDQPEFVVREEAMAVLHQDAKRLNDYYRNGEPLALGFGLYRGERLRAPVLSAIANHRKPPAATPPIATAKPVRLDSLSLFSTGSAHLKADSTKVLINALVDIKAQPGWLIVIAGHTDATGNPEHNLQLSRARAGAVRDWMQRMGDIPDSCFAVQGFGANQPIASNDTETGRTSNRRVDIRLVPEVGACMPLTLGPDRKPLSQLATFND